MASRDSNARFRILEAYARAKEANPSLTQAEFMRAGTRGLKAGKFTTDDSAARYLRKIIKGERTGGAMYREGTQLKPGRGVGLFQFRVTTGEGKVISQNIAVAGGAASTFDNAAVEYELRHSHRERIEAIIAHYRERYGQEAVEIDLDSLETRPIHHQRRPIRLWLSL